MSQNNIKPDFCFFDKNHAQCQSFFNKNISNTKYFKPLQQRNKLNNNLSINHHQIFNKNPPKFSDNIFSIIITFLSFIPLIYFLSNFLINRYHQTKQSLLNNFLTTLLNTNKNINENINKNKDKNTNKNDDNNDLYFVIKKQTIFVLNNDSIKSSKTYKKLKKELIKATAQIGEKRTF